MKKVFKLSLLLVLAAIIFFNACKKEHSCEGCINGNKPPVAKAGTDITITLPQDSAQLDGSASYDPDGSINNYQWSKISGPSSFNIPNSSSSGTMVKNLIAGVYLFELKVTDNEGLSAKDSIQVFVIDPSQPNQPPVANAGPDQTITLPNNSVTLDGTGSTDPENNITSYLWTKISGPASFNIANANAVQTQVVNLVEGVYQFELKVTDGGGLSSSDTLRVIAQPLSMGCTNRPVINATLIPVGNLSSARYKIQCATAGNKILFIGGYHTGQNWGNEPVPVDIYNIPDNTWSTHFLTPESPLFTHFRFGAGVTSVGNKIFIAGGGDDHGDNQTSKVDIYDAAANTWSIQHLSSERQGLAAASVGNNVLFAGGFGYPNGNGWGVFSTVDIYDNSTNTWSTASLSEARMDLSAVTSGDKIFFAGGRSPTGTNVSKTIDIYDANTNSWSVSSLQYARVGMASIAADNKIFWAGGIHSLVNSGWSTNNHVEILNTNSGISAVECLSGKYNFAGVKKDDNIIFFTGDPYNSSNGTVYTSSNGNDFEIYNITTNTWSIGRLNQKIFNAGIISVNNTIYVAGGVVNGFYSSQVWKLEF